MSGRMGLWAIEHVARLEHLAGSQVTGWHGVEMAVRDGEAAEPQFFDAQAPCLQLVFLQADLADGTQWTVSTYQDDANFGLRLVGNRVLRDQDWTGIYRCRDLTELPIGHVDAASARIDEGTIAELALTIAQVPILLIAGEIYENLDGSLEWHRFDESVLVFSDPSQANTITWRPPRPTR